MTDYTREWLEQGHLKAPVSSECLPPPSSNVLRAYHFTSWKHACSAIELRRLKVARFTEVNDPFELLAISFHNKNVRKVASNFKRLHDKTTGLLCFSQDWRNPVVWSHYADRHAGVCLGFDLAKGTFEHVNYEDERLREELPDELKSVEIPDKLREQLACTKSHYWRYEEEVRIFISLKSAIEDRGLFYWQFNHRLQLAEVILGPRCERKPKEMRTLVTGYSPLPAVFKARLAFRSFEVRPDGRTTRGF